MFPVLDSEQISTVIQGSPKEYGAMARFAFISDDYGLKYWDDEDYARDNYEKTKLAAQYGLAPKVGSFISFELGEEKYYGFFMERIHTLFKDWYTEKFDRGYSWWDSCYHVDQELNSLDFERYMVDEDARFQEVTITNLTEQLMEIGFGVVSDLHYENVGWMKDGRFVCIDFDNCFYTQEEHEDHLNGLK